MASQTSIPAGEARTQTVQVSPSTGPYAISWPFCALDDVVVQVTVGSVTTTKVRGVDYDITATANDDGIFPSGTINFTTAVSGTITRYRDTPAERLSNFPLTGYLERASLNADLNRAMMAVQDYVTRINRSLRLPLNDASAPAELPLAADRAGKTLLFDASGQPSLQALSGVWRGSWATATAYYAGDIVMDGPAGAGTLNVYACLSAHTSGTWATDLAAGKWILVLSTSQIVSNIGTVTSGANNVLTGNNTFDGDNTFNGDDNHTGVETFSGTLAVTGILKAKLRGYIDGLICSNNSGAPTTKIDVAAGVCQDDTNTQLMVLAASTLDCALNGAVNRLDAGSLANNTWYHLFVIGKTDGTTGVLASTSVSSPTMPTGYTLKRRIASFKTNGSAQIIAFKQVGDQFLWTGGPVQDVNTTAPGASAVTRTLTVPTGIVVFPIIHLYLYDGNAGFSDAIYLSPLDTTDISAATAGVPQVYASALGQDGAVVTNVYTNTSAQIRSRMSSGGSSQQMVIGTAGWRDLRGKDA